MSSRANLPPASQSVVQPLTRAAIFLVATVGEAPSDAAAVQSFCGDLPALVRSVGFRDIEANLSCIMGVGSNIWDRLFGQARPAELHPFKEFKSGERHAVATQGDMLFHIRARDMGLCFELASQITRRIGSAIRVVDEVYGFRYFDDRDLLGFVDGSENPNRDAADAAVYVGAEDEPFSGGTYVVVQKYLHDIEKWSALPVEAQERIIGRAKLSNIELDDAVKPSNAHNALTTITENGKELKIVRDNMPFGRVGEGEFGTYFIGYARSPRTIETMLENMFVGRPPGNYDRLLDFSTPKTGNLFFVPAESFLENI